MSKVAPIEERKADHIKINLEKDVRSALTTGLEKYHFIHEALPELNLDDVDTSLTLYSKQLNAPILISSMTGGTHQAGIINRRLAEAAQSTLTAMGVGSQRPHLKINRKPKLFKYGNMRLIFYYLQTSAPFSSIMVMALTNVAAPWT